MVEAPNVGGYRGSASQTPFLAGDFYMSHERGTAWSLENYARVGTGVSKSLKILRCRILKRIALNIEIHLVELLRQFDMFPLK